MSDTLLERYRSAVMRAITPLRAENAVLAVILYGSLADGTVWVKSSVNITVVVRDDRYKSDVYFVDIEGILAAIDVFRHTDLMNAIKEMNSPQLRSCGDPLPLPPGGDIIYCEDDSLREALEELDIVGKADMERSLLPLACDILALLKNAEKSVRVHNDAVLARHTLLEMAKPLAEMAICMNYKQPNREPIRQAAALNPELMQQFYEYPMNNALDCGAVLSLIREAYEYLDLHLKTISKHLLKYISKDGNPKCFSEIIDYFMANVIHITEYLCEKGILGKIGIPISITQNGRQNFEEIAYFYNENAEV